MSLQGLLVGRGARVRAPINLPTTPCSALRRGSGRWGEPKGVGIDPPALDQVVLRLRFRGDSGVKRAIGIAYV